MTAAPEFAPITETATSGPDDDAKKEVEATAADDDDMDRRRQGDDTPQTMPGRG
jgi:hypothetical protein